MSRFEMIFSTPCSGIYIPWLLLFFFFFLNFSGIKVRLEQQMILIGSVLFLIRNLYIHSAIEVESGSEKEGVTTILGSA